MRRQSVHARALVVRSYDFGEADRVIVLLTREFGIVRGVAKGVRRAKSRFGSRLEPFVELSVQLYQGKSLSTITQADTVEFFGAELIDDLARYAAGCAVLEGVEKLAYEGAESAALYDLAVGALKALRASEMPKLHVASFLLRAMAVTGWEPSLYQCAQCGAEGPHHAFHPHAGGAVCVMCRPAGTREVDPEALHIMWLLLQGADQAAAALVTPTRLAQVEKMVRDHLHWHSERRVLSLNVLDQA
ncbi:DNA repair protein RecO [Corynebacterium sp. 153RC1]|uniref:DNA repair protein RecO n=1 Tax=unclassified Corynebacterium TaxID=2624378 RepID=UPI00211BD3C1|nr:MULTISPECIES: DNA repair protein RecO [unclassified Corynebacterium]MCQ9370649.1 DNA repair protein RecO [Corynebacterium sp. 35RC1]MCQ9352353.1 DNA repair protein RecO [Corynebacterium sp. 209RC1]MCQ9354257.1 DNA repair protein RecO [Corynebacterium sp. 1222RC1]MCQ9356539.1 DNA repair protein RecO [Corynebacterium sp. 122RC1]MCQ9358877.1 DNA repair protein RecO [Corynebacterium sp. 142RC1]